VERCPNCGRGGKGKWTRLSAPALLTLAAEEVAEGVDMDSETIEQLVLLRKHLHKAEKEVNRRIEELAHEKQTRSYKESKIESIKRRLKL
jgi:hypothetical protein